MFAGKCVSTKQTNKVIRRFKFICCALLKLINLCVSFSLLFISDEEICSTFGRNSEYTWFDYFSFRRVFLSRLYWSHSIYYLSHVMKVFSVLIKLSWFYRPFFYKIFCSFSEFEIHLFHCCLIIFIRLILMSNQISRRSQSYCSWEKHKYWSQFQLNVKNVEDWTNPSMNEKLRGNS